MIRRVLKLPTTYLSIKQSISRPIDSERLQVLACSLAHLWFWVFARLTLAQRPPTLVSRQSPGSIFWSPFFVKHPLWSLAQLWGCRPGTRRASFTILRPSTPQSGATSSPPLLCDHRFTSLSDKLKGVILIKGGSDAVFVRARSCAAAIFLRTTLSFMPSERGHLCNLASLQGYVWVKTFRRFMF